MKTNHTVAIIQARMGSQRFPGKVLADLNGKPMLLHVIERAAQIPGVDRVAVTIPYGDVDPLMKFCDRWKVFGRTLWCEPGPENDVLERYRRTAQREEATTILRITADCPALDPVVAGQVLALFHASPACDFASNDTLISGYPDGFDCAVFSRAALETAAAQATDPTDREHIEQWFKRPSNGMRCVTLMNPEPWTGPTKLSVDTPDDLRVVREWLKGR